MPKITRVQKAILLSVIATALWLFGLRFILADYEPVHYHANFAIYVDGDRDELDSFTFYEEVSACSAEYAFRPQSRVHLHDENPFTVHVHDEAATWGHLFANLNYGITDSVLETDQIYVDNQDDKQLRFVLNGRSVRNIANATIGDEDVLLIDYSDSSENTLLMRYQDIPRDADTFNQEPDPAACAGSAEEGFWPRFKRTLGV